MSLNATEQLSEAEGSSVEWYSPPDIVTPLLEAVGGSFELDPASPVEGPIPWIKADNYLTREDDGLDQDWGGRLTWLNPPYGGDEDPALFRAWVDKWVRNGNGLWLSFNRTETAWYQDGLWPYADAIRQIRGRLNFWRRKPEATLFGPGDASSYERGGSSGAGSIVAAVGDRCVAALEALPGVTIDLRRLRS